MGVQNWNCHLLNRPSAIPKMHFLGPWKKADLNKAFFWKFQNFQFWVFCTPLFHEKMTKIDHFLQNRKKRSIYRPRRTGSVKCTPKCQHPAAFQVCTCMLMSVFRKGSILTGVQKCQKWHFFGEDFVGKIQMGFQNSKMKKRRHLI